MQLRCWAATSRKCFCARGAERTPSQSASDFCPGLPVAEPMSGKHQLVYFPFPGRAEPLRLLAKVSGFELEDVGVRGEDPLARCQMMVSSSLMGSLAKGFLRKVCGNSAESLRKLRFIAPGKGAEILRKFRGNLRKIFCNDPFPNDPISELLRWKPFLDPHFVAGAR